MNIIKSAGAFAVELLFPVRCPVCDEPVNPAGRLICNSCIPNIKYIKGSCCLKCGKVLEDAAEEYCEDCRNRKHLYTRGMAVFDYPSMAESIYRFKYKGRQEYAEFYGDRMAAALKGQLDAISPQAFVPVPIHKSRLAKRGYNQAELIARALSKRTGIPVLDDLVIRDKKTVPLKELPPSERNNNLRGAFKIRYDGVKLETIVIIDDIYTTGATVDAVTASLFACGIKNVYFAALAIGRGV